MPITANGTTYSDDQIKSFFASNPDASSVAKQAASMGLNEGQIKQAAGIAGKNWSDADINGYAQNNGYNWGASGALQSAPAGSGGAGQPAQQPASSSTPYGGMDINGTHYTTQQIKDFYASGGDDRQFVQQHGITNLDQQRQLLLQARQIAGPGTMQGDAALQHYYQQYQQYNPNGKWANDYNGWKGDFLYDPARANAIATGGYTGSASVGADSDFNGIYGPGTGHDVTYQQAGQGARGMGDGWTPGVWAGSNGATGSGIIAGATGGTGSTGVTGATGGAGTTGGTLAAGAGNGASNWTVTAPQTVGGQLGSLMDPNNGNGIIAQARTGALMGMNARGLVNSSLAQTASDAAAWNAALPIAQQDATTNANAASFNATGQNTFTLNKLNQANTMAQMGFTAQTQKDLAQAQYLYGNLQNETASASSIQSWGLNTITAIQSSDLSADAKDAAVKMVTQYLQNSYSIQGDWHNSAAVAIANIFGHSPGTTPNPAPDTQAPYHQQSLTGQIPGNVNQPGYF